jgi:phosphatidylserine decarboxylase
VLDKIKIALQHIMPKQALTELAGWAAEKKAGWFTHFVIKTFVKAYSVDMQEAEQPDPAKYQTFNEFFVRPLKEGARPIVAEANELALPADGRISQLGAITQNKIIQAKNHDYTLEALLACDKQMVMMFQNGLFVTTYLSPRDYHRVHMPCDGVLREMLYVPGDLFSVNPLTSENVANLFARNERLICLFDTPFGPMAQILVGATIVGSIETVWAGVVTPPRQGIIQRWEYPAVGKNAIKLNKGDEMGRFKLGSTVINLFAENSVTLSHQLNAKSPTRMGSLLAVCLQNLHTDEPESDE